MMTDLKEALAGLIALIALSLVAASQLSGAAEPQPISSGELTIVRGLGRLQSRVTELESRQDAAECDVAFVKDDITTMKRDVADQGRDIARNRQRMDVSERRLDDHDAAIHLALKDRQDLLKAAREQAANLERESLLRRAGDSALARSVAATTSDVAALERASTRLAHATDALLADNTSIKASQERTRRDLIDTRRDLIDTRRELIDTRPAFSLRPPGPITVTAVDVKPGKCFLEVTIDGRLVMTRAVSAGTRTRLVLGPGEVMRVRAVGPFLLEHEGARASNLHLKGQ